MNWQASLKGDPLTWLLEHEQPGVRYLAQRELLDVPPEDFQLLTDREEAHARGPIAAILAEITPDGYWVKPGPGYLPKYRSTVWSVIMLAQLGANIAMDERIGQACAYVLEASLATGGQFSSTGAPSGTADCLQGNLCYALVSLGCDDLRLVQAYEWMARTVTGEGVAPNTERKAPVRYYAGKCGPWFACGANNKLPCAWGAAKVMLAFAVLPSDRRTPLVERAIEAGVDFLFSVDPATAGYPCGYASKPSRNWWKIGFRFSMSLTCCRLWRPWPAWAMAKTRAWRMPWRWWWRSKMRPAAGRWNKPWPGCLEVSRFSGSTARSVAAGRCESLSTRLDGNEWIKGLGSA